MASRAVYRTMGLYCSSLDTCACILNQVKPATTYATSELQAPVHGAGCKAKHHY